MFFDAAQRDAQVWHDFLSPDDPDRSGGAAGVAGELASAARGDYEGAGLSERGDASPGAWLRTVASRICLNVLGSARARRETYVGEWIPEPLPEPTEWITGRSSSIAIDPADRSPSTSQ